MAPAMQPSHTEYEKPFYKPDSKDYLRDSGNISVNFNSGFEEEKELNSSNTFLDPNN